MDVKTINNPRKSNGDFGDFCCEVCGNYTGAYIVFKETNICQSCLLRWVDSIRNTILQDAVDKGRLRGLK